MTEEEWDDESHNFTIRESYEVARIVDMLLETDQCLRIKAAAMFAVVMADNQGLFKTGRRLNNFHCAVEAFRDRVKKVYIEERRHVEQNEN